MNSGSKFETVQLYYDRGRLTQTSEMKSNNLGEMRPVASHHWYWLVAVGVIDQQPQGGG